jgi:hypothetical protein
MHLITTRRTTYAMSALDTAGKMWQFNEGTKVRIRGYDEGKSAIVVRRLAGHPFPHYEVMDDDGTMLRIAQLELIPVRP